jgi:hypothetical protein
MPGEYMDVASRMASRLDMYVFSNVLWNFNTRLIRIKRRLMVLPNISRHTIEGSLFGFHISLAYVSIFGCCLYFIDGVVLGHFPALGWLHNA